MFYARRHKYFETVLMLLTANIPLNEVLKATNHLFWTVADADADAGDISVTLKGDDKSKFGLLCWSVELSSFQDVDVGDILDRFHFLVKTEKLYDLFSSFWCVTKVNRTVKHSQASNWWSRCDACTEPGRKWKVSKLLSWTAPAFWLSIYDSTVYRSLTKTI